MNHDGGAVRVKQRIRSRFGQAYQSVHKLDVRRAIRPGRQRLHVACVRSRGVLQAVFLIFRIEVRPGGGKAWRVTFSDGVDVDAVRSWRELAHIQRDPDPILNLGECRGADLFSLRVVDISLGSRRAHLRRNRLAKGQKQHRANQSCVSHWSSGRV